MKDDEDEVFEYEDFVVTDYEGSIRTFNRWGDCMACKSRQTFDSLIMTKSESCLDIGVDSSDSSIYTRLRVRAYCKQCIELLISLNDGDTDIEFPIDEKDFWDNVETAEHIIMDTAQKYKKGRMVDEL